MKTLKNTIVFLLILVAIFAVTYIASPGEVHKFFGERTAVQPPKGVLNVVDANGGTYTLTEAELLGVSILEMNAGGAGQAIIALTLPATSTLTSLMPNAGDYREWLIDASALAAATTTTVTAGTGINLIGVTTDDDLIDGLEWARLSCWRKENTDVDCITSELINVD